MAASTINAITLFFALLAVVAAAIAIGIAVSVAVGDRLGLIPAFRSVALELAAAVATTAMVGSLILSEWIGYEPCLNCWIQRGFMYPASFLLIGSVITKRMTPAKVAGVLAVLGLCVSIFHRYEQATGVEIGGLCDASAPCSTKFVEQFGFMTIPTMAGCGFAAIIALVAIKVWPLGD
jgi:disulfide bond formation protein DsbB